MKFKRSSGVLLHPTSLPGKYGIGDLAGPAYWFVDFLVASGQTYWQIMPLSPTGAGNSPYSSYSAFAGNTLLISPEVLFGDGLLTEAEIKPPLGLPADRIDYGRVIAYKRELLDKAFGRFKERVKTDASWRGDYERFLDSARLWLDDYSLFSALRDDHKGASWHTWEPGLARREPKALDEARKRLAERIEAQRFLQFAFFRQWSNLKRYANDRGIRILGDMPIFVAHNSADVWARPEFFCLGDAGLPTVVAGVPPDAFSETGQLWGNPIYNWDALRKDGFAWWVSRVRETLKSVDLVRVDHFRGFAAYWEVPAGEKTAIKGQWVEAPGHELFHAMQQSLGADLPIVAEDLGTITPDVHKLRDDFGFAGMRVLQFAFGGDPHDAHLPHEYPRNCIAYTGTHDNDTVLGWFFSRNRPNANDAEKRERWNCLRYLGTDGRDINWTFLRAVQMSVADVAVVPLQDLLGLGTEGRMNVPAIAEGNWRWRYQLGALTDSIRDRFAEMTGMYGRWR